MKIKNLIDLSLKEFYNQFKTNPNLFINNESDIKCIIYSKILEKIKEINGKDCLLLTEFEVINKTPRNNNSKTHPNKYDLVILDKNGINEYYNNSNNKTPPYIAIELKHSTDNQEQIKHDLVKLTDKKNQIEHSYFILVSNFNDFKDKDINIKFYDELKKELDLLNINYLILHYTHLDNNIEKIYQESNFLDIHQ